MNRSLERLIEHAGRVLDRGEPLPVDMTARLLDAGIDVANLTAGREAAFVCPDPSDIEKDPI